MYVPVAGGDTLTREDFDPNNPAHYEQLTRAEAKNTCSSESSRFGIEKIFAKLGILVSASTSFIHYYFYTVEHTPVIAHLVALFFFCFFFI